MSFGSVSFADDDYEWRQSHRATEDHSNLKNEVAVTSVPESSQIKSQTCSEDVSPDDNRSDVQEFPSIQSLPSGHSSSSPETRQSLEYRMSTTNRKTFEYHVPTNIRQSSLKCYPTETHSAGENRLPTTKRHKSLECLSSENLGNLQYQPKPTKDPLSVKNYSPEEDRQPNECHDRSNIQHDSQTRSSVENIELDEIQIPPIPPSEIQQPIECHSPSSSQQDIQDRSPTCSSPLSSGKRPNTEETINISSKRAKKVSLVVPDREFLNIDSSLSPSYDLESSFTDLSLETSQRIVADLENTPGFFTMNYLKQDDTPFISFPSFLANSSESQHTEFNRDTAKMKNIMKLKSLTGEHHAIVLLDFTDAEPSVVDSVQQHLEIIRDNISMDAEISIKSLEIVITSYLKKCDSERRKYIARKVVELLTLQEE